MNKLSIFSLKALRKIYTKFHPSDIIIKPKCDKNPDSVSQTIYKTLLSDKPCMIARFGAVELTCLINYIGVHNTNNKTIKGYISNQSPAWWWDISAYKLMQSNAGFFPLKISKIEKFCDLMLTDIQQIDILGSWLTHESLFEKELANVAKVQLMYLDPYWSKLPWTRALMGKKILIVHPFAETIKKQYAKRKYLFVNQNVLPEFKSLTAIKAVQSLGKGDDRFSDWFEALDYMKTEIENCDFDICLIGCGAYGLPLAAHVKRLGKKAVHMGGSLQLLFGIKGKRWEIYDPHYEQPGNIFIHYSGLINEYWVRPADTEKPENHKKVEDSCYW